MAVLGTLGFPERTVPNGFAIPFHFYNEFMNNAVLKAEKVFGKGTLGTEEDRFTLAAGTKLIDAVKAILVHPKFQTDFEIQDEMLDDLREVIEEAESPLWMKEALTAMHAECTVLYGDECPVGRSLRYRSSTNNEDLPGFSGAGLYDSNTQKQKETANEGIDKSMKQVFASLWNFRAFTEREFHRIDHLATAMGVLVHPNYSDELANGVAASFDPVGGLNSYYYLNTQLGEDLVTNPEANSEPEEILLHQSGNYYEILATSNQVAPGTLLMSDAQMKQLAEHLTVIHEKFAGLYGSGSNRPFAIEIEFKITVDNILAIKQARPWVFSVVPTATAISGSGGGGGGGGPSPSVVDFEWTVKHDIENLDSGHDKPTGSWSDGLTLWIVDNGDGADDEVYAYDLASGERVEDREFMLDDTNRAPRGFWSHMGTVWVSDSGRDHVYAYDLATGERLEKREIELDEANDDARGIWSDGETLWVLDDRAQALFAYDLESGQLLAHHVLDSDNDTPHGIWSDGVTVWVSDHGAKRLVAYRLPSLQPEAGTVTAAQAGDGSPQALERVRDEEFGASRELTKASNNSPRGIWSDGDVMYVVDASDGRVYSYNMPDAIDARLASLELSGVEFGGVLAGSHRVRGSCRGRRHGDDGRGDGGAKRRGRRHRPARRRRGSRGLPGGPGGPERDHHHRHLRGREPRARLPPAPRPGGSGRARPGLPARRDRRGLQPRGLRGRHCRGAGRVCAQPRRHGPLRPARGRLCLLRPWCAGLREQRVHRAVRRRRPVAHAADRGEQHAVGGRAARRGRGGRWRVLAGVPARRHRRGLQSRAVRGRRRRRPDRVCAQQQRHGRLCPARRPSFVSYIVGAPGFVNSAFIELFAEGLPSFTPLVAKK